MFPWTKQARRLAEQQEAIAALRKRCLALEEAAKTDKESRRKEISELRAACIQQESYTWGGLRRMLFDDPVGKPYTAMDAVRLLLDKSGLTIDTEPSKGAKHKLVPVNKAKR